MMLSCAPDILSSGFSYDFMCIFDPSRELIVRHNSCSATERIPRSCALSRLQLHEILRRRRKKPEWSALRARRELIIS